MADRKWYPLDHKREAEKLLEQSRAPDLTPEVRDRKVLAALVHAVLSTNKLGPI
jgi:hypothetical protein